MEQLRQLSGNEHDAIVANGCFATDWSRVRVCDPFSPSQLTMSRFEGDIEIGAGAQVHNSTIKNYSLGEGARVERVALLECTGSSFGNGVGVASLNECGGREIKIYDSMSAQVAYVATIYRHRPQLIETLDAMATAYAATKYSQIGSVGRNSSIIGAGIIRNVCIGNDVRVEGSSTLSNGTILDKSYFGADVKADDFIAVEGSKVSNGAIVERCFVGENAIISNGFTAVDSLFFASSHCENGEAASVFAGPYTVSHHKSSLLIAGMFSFFNAGSGSNQSNHLFKCGPVHQGVHMRGCKFGSSAYVMLPAVNGAYTTVIGSHSAHHDISDFPFSYLIVKEGRSSLIPASNISSYGYMRDIEKWVKRDRREVKRDVLNLEEHNPYIGGMLLDAINTSNTLIEKHPDAQSHIHKNVMISSNNLNRGLGLYNKYFAGMLGAMLSYRHDSTVEGEGRCRWVDVAGQYITKNHLEAILSEIEQGALTTYEAIDAKFRHAATLFEPLAHDWAVGVLSQLLGHTPSGEEIEQTIEAAKGSREQIKAMAMRDMQRDNSAAMSISYGIDGDSEQERMDDFNAVRSL